MGNTKKGAGKQAFRRGGCELEFALDFFLAGQVIVFLFFLLSLPSSLVHSPLFGQHITE